jgi:hypothetical protein
MASIPERLLHGGGMSGVDTGIPADNRGAAMKKLSHLQKTILGMAKQQGHITNANILTAV